MKRWFMLLVLVLPLGVFAEKVEKGQSFPVYTLEDPHGVTNTLRAETRFVIIASEMPISKSVTAWLTTKAPEFLEQHRAEYVSDVTPMPAIISFLFAKPKMRKYPFRMLLAEDPSFAQTYPSQEGKLALFVLDENRLITDLHFLAKPEELEALLK